MCLLMLSVLFSAWRCSDGGAVTEAVISDQVSVGCDWNPPSFGLFQVLVWHTRTEKPHLANEPKHRKDTVFIEVWFFPRSGRPWFCSHRVNWLRTRTLQELHDSGLLTPGTSNPSMNKHFLHPQPADIKAEVWNVMRKWKSAIWSIIFFILIKVQLWHHGIKIACFKKLPSVWLIKCPDVKAHVGKQLYWFLFTNKRGIGKC